MSPACKHKMWGSDNEYYVSTLVSPSFQLLLSLLSAISNWRKLKKYLPKANIFSSVPLNKCNGVEEFPPAGP